MSTKGVRFTNLVTRKKCMKRASRRCKASEVCTWSEAHCRILLWSLLTKMGIQLILALLHNLLPTMCIFPRLCLQDGRFYSLFRVSRPVPRLYYHCVEFTTLPVLSIKVPWFYGSAVLGYHGRKAQHATHIASMHSTILLQYHGTENMSHCGVIFNYHRSIM